MPNHALVVGIAAYEDRGVPSLQTPVADALRVAAWLLDPAGGNVLPANLILLLSPNPPAQAPPAGIDLNRLRALGNLRTATHDNLLQAALDADTPHGGDRLFFYYAGHGLQTHVSFSTEDALVPSDYRPGVRNPLAVSSLLQFCQATHFVEQFFFFDCCRNQISLDERRLDAVAAKVPDSSLPPWNQFILNATVPGGLAVDDRGRLTEVLLEALGGAGQAKIWDGVRQQYLVRLDRLFAYLRERFDTQPVVQIPRLGGEHSREDVVLATLPATAVAHRGPRRGPGAAGGSPGGPRPRATFQRWRPFGRAFRHPRIAHPLPGCAADVPPPPGGGPGILRRHRNLAARRVRTHDLALRFSAASSGRSPSSGSVRPGLCDSGGAVFGPPDPDGG